MPNPSTSKKKKPTRATPPPASKPTKPAAIDWSQPVDVHDVDLAFPAHAIGRFMPPVDDIPKEIKRSPWMNIASMWFYNGIRGALIPKPGVDLRKAVRQLS